MGNVVGPKAKDNAAVIASDAGNAIVAFDQYQVDLAQNDTLDILKVPAGATIIDGWVAVDTDVALLTLAAGTSESGEGSAFLAAEAAATGKVPHRFSAGLPYVCGGDRTIRITVGGANPGATVKFSAMVKYLLP
ncbi:MAG: hypothetical protein EHM36_01925 [Deltaproteobacteria bacterium]|nr:MAG: hypothetical protein EHM36_01925 [Deltaproteobacteria bacterium]